MTNFLKFLDGRKAIIFSVLILLIEFAEKMNYIDANIAGLIRGILAIITGGAVYATNSSLGRRNFQGIRIK